MWTPNPKARDPVPLCEACEAEMSLCKGPCGRKLPRGAFDRDAHRHWYKVCRECQFPACATCGRKSEDIWTPPPSKANAKYTCQKCQQLRTCKGLCKQALPFSAFDKNSCGNYYKCCRACQYPKCATCGRKRKAMWTPSPKARDPVPLCEACETKKKKKVKT